MTISWGHKVYAQCSWMLGSRVTARHGDGSRNRKSPRLDPGKDSRLWAEDDPSQTAYWSQHTGRTVITSSFSYWSSMIFWSFLMFFVRRLTSEMLSVWHCTVLNNVLWSITEINTESFFLQVALYNLLMGSADTLVSISTGWLLCPNNGLLISQRQCTLNTRCWNCFRVNL